MTFICKFRDACGGVFSRTIEADSRSSVIQILKKEGLCPISITMKEASAAREHPTLWKYITSAFLVVGLGIASVFLILSFIGNGDIKESSSEVPQKRSAKPSMRVATTNHHPTVLVKSKKNVGISHPRKLTRDERLAQKIASGETAKWIDPPPSKIFEFTNNVPSVFKFSAEDEIAKIVCYNSGEEILPEIYGKVFDLEFNASLKIPIEIKPDDTEEIAARKRAVIEAKKVILEEVAKGKTPSEVMRETQKELMDMAAYRDSLDRGIDQIRQTGTAAEVAEYIEAANRMLSDYGIKHPLRLTLREKLKLRKEKRK